MTVSQQPSLSAQDTRSVVDALCLSRRTAALSLPALFGALPLVQASAQSAGPAAPKGPLPGRLKVAAVLYDDFILLDAVAPLTAMNLAMFDIDLVARSTAAVRSELGINVTPTASFEDYPHQADILFIPGGLGGTIAAMQDEATLAFVKRQAAAATWVTSVCTGSLLLGAAGLLKGYKATSHWYVRELLKEFGAEAVDQRVVTDRNRITAGGVTAGLDFGLSLVGLIRGEDYAKRVQLTLEYDPKPPFSAGSPQQAGPALVNDVLGRRAKLLDETRTVVARTKL